MKVNKVMAAAVIASLSGLAATAATAHESRNVNGNGGMFRLTAGFNVEPAYEDSYNGIDFFINAYDGPAPGNFDTITASVNRNAGDVVKLKVTALFLDKDAPLGEATIKASKVIADDNDPNAVHTRLPFGETNVYNVPFRPTHAGAYGFHFEGDVSFAGRDADPYCLDADCASTDVSFVAARTIHIDEYFICGNGHAPADANHSGRYGCIEILPPFPGKPEDAYKPNKPPKIPVGGH